MLAVGQGGGHVLASFTSYRANLAKRFAFSLENQFSGLITTGNYGGRTIEPRRHRPGLQVSSSAIAALEFGSFQDRAYKKKGNFG